MTERNASRRCFVRLGGLMTLGLVAACAPAAQPTPATPPKPTAAPQPTAAAPKPTQAATAKPAPAAAAKPTVAPTVVTFAPAAVTFMNQATTRTKALDEIGQTQGYYRQFGLNATMLPQPDDTKTLAAILTGSADMAAHAGVGPVCSAIAQGADLKFLSAAATKLNFIVYTGNPAVKTLKDLEGKVVGISAPGALLHAMMLAMFQKHGVDAKKVDFVTVGASTDVYRAVAAKKVDAGPAQNDFMPRIDQDGVSAITEVWKELPGYLTTIFYSSGRAISEKRDVLIRTLAVWGQIYRFMRKPESEAAYATAYKNQGGAEAEATYAWKWLRENQGFSYDLTLSQQDLQYTQQVNADAGSQPSVLPYEKVVDSSLARDALKIMTVQ